MPLIIGHRGASSFAPENTLAAFRRAIDDGAEGIELDVRLAADGVPVVHHDATLKRTAGRDVRIADLTSQKLAEADVGSWFEQHAPNHWRPEYAGERIPTLQATLQYLEDFRGLIYIELKCAEDEARTLVGAVCDLLAGSSVADRAIVKSFRLACIPEMRTRMPGVRTAALFAPKIMTILRKEKYLVNLAVEFGADQLSVHYSLATKKLMKNAEKRSLPVTIWTVDHPRWLKRSLKLGLDALITNDPGRMLALRQRLLV